MKTKEFIEKIEEFGLSVINYNVKNILFVGDARRYYFSLSSAERYKFEVFHNHLAELDEETRHKLLDLVVEYAKTPIEEREGQKKYYLRLPDLVSSNWSYLNLWVTKGIYYFSCSDEMDGKYKIKFTQDEIDKLPHQDFIKTLIKEEVQDV